MSAGGNDEDLFAELERRALMGLSEEDEAEAGLDLAAGLEAESPQADAADSTLGGYIEKHDRVPAFEGADGQPYTVDVDTEETGDPQCPAAAFLIFLRWAATGAGIMDHVESDTVATGRTPEEARRNALDLSLYEVKAELDAAIERRRRELED